jgi:hypothetical protein
MAFCSGLMTFWAGFAKMAYSGVFIILLNESVLNYKALSYYILTIDLRIFVGNIYFFGKYLVNCIFLFILVLTGRVLFWDLFIQAARQSGYVEVIWL